MSHPIHVRYLLVGAAAALFAAGCVNDNSPGQTGQKVSTSFVGYSNPDTKQTTCGNCHVLKQETWANTGHAKAWEDLQASGHAGASCNKCHTTNGATNIGADTAGFFSASPSAQKYFYDVQCEACHGPGVAHVTTPDETQPIPYLVSNDTTALGQGVGCGQCHSGPPHNPFLEDWEHGAHGEVISEAAGNTSCKPCHEGKTAAIRFGSSTTFVESSNTTLYPIGCTTCHNPHGSANTNEARVSVTARDTSNLCIQCHHKRGQPDLTTWRGAHSPQGYVFLGIAGWIPPGFTLDSSDHATHSDPTANPGMCTTCHMATIDVTSGGSLAYHYTGHRFWAAPCMDPTTGLPDSTNTCDDANRNFSACAKSGCHSSASGASSLLQSLDAQISYFADAIWVDVNDNGKVDSLDTGLLTQVPSTEFKTRSAATATTPLTVAEGAAFNVGLFHADRSHGAHNPAYMTLLMIKTLEAVQTQYGLAAPAAVQTRLRAEEAKLSARVATR